MLEDILAFAALPLAAAVVFTGIHTWFGLQVLRRNVVFADLALAQVNSGNYSAIVFVGGWGASMYQYAYSDPRIPRHVHLPPGRPMISVRS